MVPGVALVDWALRLARRELGLNTAPRALEAVKFQQALLPGADFELVLSRESERVDWRFRQGETPVASGRARFDDAPEAHRAADVPDAPAETTPVSIPQFGPMRLIDAILRHDGKTTLCRATVRAESPLCEASSAPSWCALEWLAQGMAAAGGLRSDGAGPVGPAFLASARRIALSTDHFRVGEALWIRAEHLRGERGAVAFACALGTGHAPSDRSEAEAHSLAHGTLTAFVA